MKKYNILQTNSVVTDVYQFFFFLKKLSVFSVINISYYMKK